MNVKFTMTTAAKLSQLAVINGQLIYLQDIDEVYYDAANTRNRIGGVQAVNSLPETGRDGTLYVTTDSAGRATASIWSSAASSYLDLSGSVATVSSVGLVQPDGSTITINSNGVISFKAAPGTAITYDNAASGLSATNVKTAIDEVASSSTAVVSRVTGLESTVVDLDARLQALEALMPWEGTRNSWNSLPSATKSKYKVVNIIDE